MRRRTGAVVGALSLLVLAVGVVPARTDEPKPPAVAATATPSDLRKAAERGLEFLKVDAAKWRAERQCATCHHGTMTVWALVEAKQRGYPVTAELLADTATWAKERLAKIDEPRPVNVEPGWRMISTPALYLAVMSRVNAKQDVLSVEELDRIADHLIRYQEENGSWMWSLAPPANRYPPFFESDEVATSLAITVLRGYAPREAQALAAARKSRDKAAAWLATSRTPATTQALAFDLLDQVVAGGSESDRQARIESLLRLQREDGGWGQLDDRASDAYATGQVLYVLCLAGVDPSRAEVRRGAAFLMATQRDDGSWPMIPRGHPGSKAANFKVPITYFGSAWGTLALMRAAED